MPRIIVPSFDTKLNLHGLTLVALAGAWLSGILVASFFSISPPYFLIMAAIALLSTLFLRRTLIARLILLLIFSCTIGAWRYTEALPANDPQTIASHIGSQTIQVQGTVSDEPELAGRTRLLKVVVSGIAAENSFNWETIHGTIEVQTAGTTIDDAYSPNYGDILTLQGKLVPPPSHSPPDILAQMSFPRLTINQNVGNPIIAFLYHWRIQFALIIGQTLPQPLAALLVAIVLGLRTPALTPLKQAFNVTGTAHLIVPSGFKVTIVAGLVASSTRWLYEGRIAKKLSHYSRYAWQRKLSTLLMLLSIASYTILSGAGAAAIRSGIMGSLLVIAPRMGRTYNIYTALAFTAIGMSILDPFILWDTGFQLSFLGTLGIVLFTPYVQRLLHPLHVIPGGHFLAETSAVTIAAQMATLPIFAITFRQISFIAPIANILTVPLLGIVITLGLLICILGLISLPLALLTSWIAWPLLWYMSQSILWCASLPGAYMLVTTLDNHLIWIYYLPLTLLFIFLLWRCPDPKPIDRPKAGTKPISKNIRRLLYAGVALTIVTTTGLAIIYTQSNGQLEVTFLSVGPAGKSAQGEAILVHTADNHTLLIDGGLDPTSLSQKLDSHLPIWQHSLDIVILTSPRSDHLSGLLDIVDRYSIGEIIDGGMLHPSTAYASWQRSIRDKNIRYHLAVQGQIIPLGQEAQIQILWPPPTRHQGTNNVRDNSLIFRLVMPELRCLFLGETAQSNYALTGLQTQIIEDKRQAEVVQIVAGVKQPVTNDLEALIKEAYPSMLVISPPVMRNDKKPTAPPAKPVQDVFSISFPTLRIISTAQTGDLDIVHSEHGWKLNTP